MHDEFDRIYELYNKCVFRLSYSYLLNKSDSEDVLQKTFFKLYKNKKILSLKDEEIKKWLFRVCVNESKDLLKSSWKKKVQELEDNMLVTRSDDKKEDLIESLKSISSENRIPLFLYYYEGYKLKEIAKILKKSESTVKNRINNGKNELKMEMEGVL